VERIVSIALASLLLVSTSRAQSCSRADSLLGPKTNGYVRAKYDNFTDSTNIEGAPEGDFSFVSQEGGAVISFTSHFKGKTASEAPMTTGQMVIISALGPSTRGAEAPSASAAKYQSLDAVNLLLDDSVRLTLPVAHASIRTQQGDGLNPAMLLETLYLTVKPDDIVRIGTAKKAAIRAGTLTKKFSDRFLKSIREQVRMDLCATPQREG
jgi:hypothetical protein